MILHLLIVIFISLSSRNLVQCEEIIGIAPNDLMFIADHSFDLHISQNKTVIEGQIIQMDCPNYFSLFNRQPFIDFDIGEGLRIKHYENNDINFTNIFWHGINLNNTGYYSCRSFGGPIDRPRLNLTVLKGPNPTKVEILTLKQTPDKPFYKQDEFVTIQCCTNPDAYPRALYRWHKNETDISRRQKLTKSCTTLEVLANKNDNMVLYTCSAIKYAYIEEFLDFDIKHLQALPLGKRFELDYIIGSKEEVLISKNTTIVVMDMPKVSIFMNDSKLQHTNFLDVFEVDFSMKYSLFINATGSYSSNDMVCFWLANNNSTIPLNNSKILDYAYICKNKRGITSGSIKINKIDSHAYLEAVNKTTNSSLSTENSIYISAPEATNLKLSCQLNTDNLQKEITWFKITNNQKKEVDSEFSYHSYTTDGLGTFVKYDSIVEFKNTVPEDIGSYSCVIETHLENSIGKRKTILNSLTYFLDVQYKPRVFFKNSSIEALIGEIVKLECFGDSNPVAPMRLYFNGICLTQTNENTLIIKITANRTTYGVYKCVVDNGLGTSEALFELKEKLLHPIEQRKPDILNINSNSIILGFDSYDGNFNADKSLTYILSVNDQFNIKIIPNTQNNYQIIQLDGLKPSSLYNFKLCSSNTAGTSNFSEIRSANTLPTSSNPEDLPVIQKGSFDISHESICFKTTRLANTKEQTYLVRLIVQTYVEFSKLSNNNYEMIDFRIQPQDASTFCVLFSEIKSQAEVARNNLVSFNVTYGVKRFDLRTLEPGYSQAIITNVSFIKFTELNRINVTICNLNETTVCSESVLINHETYFPLMTLIGSLLIICLLILMLVLVIYKCLNAMFDDDEREEKMKKIQKVGVESVLKSLTNETKV